MHLIYIRMLENLFLVLETTQYLIKFTIIKSGSDSMHILSAIKDMSLCIFHIF